MPPDLTKLHLPPPGQSAGFGSALMNEPQADAASAEHFDAPLGEVAVSPLDPFAVLSSGGSLTEMLDLLEAWSPEEERMHPRWPSGTPGGLGGKFMKTGQRFLYKGQEYDVAFTAPGGVYAHVATKGDPKKAKLVWLATKDIEDGHAVLKGVTRPTPDIPGGYRSGKASESSLITATTVDPYVQDDHDPSIPLPADAPQSLTAERWQRFGRADQLRYVDLMHQFGKWNDTKAQALVDSELSKQPQHAVEFLMGAYAHQFGTSDSFAIGLYQKLKKWVGVKPSPSQIAAMEKDRAEYEQVKRAQDAAARAIQWDIYNRLASPDLLVFHKSGESPSTWKAKRLSGKESVYSGLSMAQRYRPGGFGSTAVATPLAIRQIALATWSADVYKHHGFKGLNSENEVSVPEPMRFDARTLVFGDSELSPPQQQYLSQATMLGVDGTVLESLRDNIEKGIPLPALPESAHVQMVGDTAAQWLPPPPAATKGIGKLGYADLDANGNPIAKPANQLELKPGDYIEGMQGTRYIIVADPSDPFGIRYYKVTDPGTAAAGGAFTNHSDYQGAPECYTFESGGVKPFKLLAGHFDLPSLSQQAKTGFVMSAWSQSGDQKFVKDMPTGTKFVVNGIPYEKTGDLAGHQASITSLDTGQPGQINGGYKTTWLKLKPGYAETGEKQLDPSQFFVASPQPLSAMGLHDGDVFLAGSDSDIAWKVIGEPKGGEVSMVQVQGPDIGKTKTIKDSVTGRRLVPKPTGWAPPQPGDTLAVNGKKGTVTKLLKNGEVQVNLAPGVVKLKPDDPLLAGLFSPGKVTLGPKAKLKDMAPGTRFHGGTGGKVRPYELVGFDGAKARIRNLDTGEESVVSRQRSFALLVSQHMTAPEPDAPKGTPVGEVFNPAAWKQSEGTVPAHQLKVGDKFYSPVGNAVFEVTADKGAAWEVKNLETGSVMPMTKSSVEFHFAVPSNVMPPVAWDPGSYEVGKPTPLKAMKVGDIFQGTKAGKHYLITKTGAKSGLSAVDLETGKTSSPWKYEKVAPLMVPKGAVPISKAKLTKGDPVLLNQLLPGEQFTISGQLHEVVEAPSGATGNATVAPVLPGGGLGFPGKVGFYPGLQVSFFANVHDAQEAKTEAALLAHAKVAKTGDLPYLTPQPVNQDIVGGVVPFSPKSKTGGGYVFAKAKNAVEGTVLEDKAGRHFKVKVQGADPVVSDGKAHWKLNGELNLKVVEAPFDDQAGDLSALSADAATVAGEASVPPMGAPAAGASMQSLDLQVGDWVQVGGVKQKVTAITKDQYGKPGMFKTELTDGLVNLLGPEIEPEAYAYTVKAPTGAHEQYAMTGAGGVPLQVGDQVSWTGIDGEQKTGKVLGKDASSLSSNNVSVQPGGTGSLAVVAGSKLFKTASAGTAPPTDVDGNEIHVGDKVIKPSAKNGIGEVHSINDSGNPVVAWPDGGAFVETPASLQIAGSQHPLAPPAVGTFDPSGYDEVQTPMGSLKQGDIFVNKNNAEPMYYKVGATTAGTTHLEGLNGAPDYDAGFYGSAPVTKLEPKAQAAAPAHTVAFNEDELADNSLVKLQLGQLKPGTLYKSVFGAVWLFQGKDPNDPGGGITQLVEPGQSTFTAGSMQHVGLSHVPDAVGVEPVKFATGDWEPSGEKKLLSQVQPGDVFELTGGGGLVKALEKSGDTLTVVHANPNTEALQGVQSQPYTVPITVATQVTLWDPYSPEPAASGSGFVPFSGALSDLGPGDQFMATEDPSNPNATVWQVEAGHGPAGAVPTTIVKSPAHPDKVGMLVWQNPASTASTHVKKAEVPFDAGAKVSISDVPAGSFLTLASPMASGDTAAIWKVVAKPDGAKGLVIEVPGKNADGSPFNMVKGQWWGGSAGVDEPLWKVVSPFDPALEPQSGSKSSETDAYLAQALIDAWHAGDQDAYFAAEDAAAQHLGIDLAGMADEPPEYHEDASAQMDNWLKKAIADFQLTAPGGGAPFGGQEPGLQGAPGPALPTPELHAPADIPEGPGPHGWVGATQPMSSGTVFEKIALPTTASAASLVPPGGGPASTPGVFHVGAPAGWKPFSAKSKTGGGYHFKNMGQLEPGELFTDKSGSVYVAGDPTADGKMEFWLQDGDVNAQPFAAPAHHRVKLL